MDGGAEGVRTPDLLNAIQALYQLSYDPIQSDQSKTAEKNVKIKKPHLGTQDIEDFVARVHQSSSRL